MSSFFEEIMPDNFLEFTAALGTITVSYYLIDFYRSKYYSEKMSKEELVSNFEKFLKEKEEFYKEKEEQILKKLKENTLDQETINKIREAI